jgi:hypothetical protein
MFFEGKAKQEPDGSISLLGRNSISGQEEVVGSFSV